MVRSPCSAGRWRMAAACCLAALAPQHWRLLILGAPHASRHAGEQVTRVLEAVKPSLVLLELDRLDFASLVSAASLGADVSKAPAAVAARHTAEAVPEAAAALRWVARAGEASASYSHRVLAAPLDRPQLTTRRRLAWRMLQQPAQLFSARRHWGGTPPPGGKGPEAARAWRERLRDECPTLHDVVIEERDEFMAYQVLLRLEAHLACVYEVEYHHQGCATDSEGARQLLARRGARDAERVGSALTWALDGPPCGGGGLWAQPAWSSSLRRPPRLPEPERVVVICGPAHVDGLAARLAAFLGGETTGVAPASRQLLARNAALLPRLLANADMVSWADVDGYSEPHSVLLEEASAALQSVGPTESDVASQHRPSDTIAARVGGSGRFGPLAGAVESFFEDEAAVQTSGKPKVPAGGPVFVQDRLRDLSFCPLNAWPAFFGLYLVGPVLLFIVIPAKIDLYWFDPISRIS